MTPQERLEMEEHRQWMRQMEKRHEENRISHESWMMDHERWMRDTESWMQEITKTMAALAAGHQRLQEGFERLRAEQELTQKKLQAFIDSLRRGGNGHS